jgi:peptide deformylase
MNTLEIIEFGNPLLRKTAKKVPISTIKAVKFQNLIKNIRHTLIDQELGVALASPQIGESLALAVIAVRPTAHRPRVKEFDLVIINPSYNGVGDKKEMWEGCISSGAGQAGLFAKVPRYKKIETTYFDEKAVKHTRQFSGLVAQIIQHETDHLNGILFVDKVLNTKTYMSMSEYRKRITPTK